MTHFVVSFEMKRPRRVPDEHKQTRLRLRRLVLVRFAVSESGVSPGRDPDVGAIPGAV